MSSKLVPLTMRIHPALVGSILFVGTLGDGNKAACGTYKMI